MKQNLLKCLSALLFLSMSLYAQKPVSMIPSSPRYLYDVDKDGIMDVLSVNEYGKYPGLCWYSVLTGDLVREVEPNFDKELGMHNIIHIGDFNNDGEADILFYDWAKGISFYMSAGDKYELINTGMTYDIELKSIDVNKDGLTDLFYFKNVSEYKYIPYLMIQTHEGNFYEQKLRIEQNTDKLAGKPFSTGGNGVYYKPMNLNFGGVWLPDESYYKPEDGTTFDDINQDGYPDIVNKKSGLSYLSMGDGSYYEASFNGMIQSIDLNNDGWPDLVSIDSKTGDVKVFWSSAEGFTTQTLFQNKLASNIYCADIDKDSDTDIIITMDTPDRGAKIGYIIFMLNQGNGTFRKKERSIDGTCLFHECNDFSGDGTYSLSVMVNERCYLASWDNSLEITLTPVPLYFGMYSSGSFFCTDVDNNGKLEFIGEYQEVPGEISYKAMWEPSSVIAQRPSVISAPKAHIDPESKMLRIGWDAATDKENPSNLLKYHVRIGSQSGKDDIVASNASVDGKKCSYTLPNAGSYTFYNYNINALPSGKYYIAVQAIDPMNQSGKWSEELIYDHTSKNTDMIVNNSVISTVDTLTVEPSLPYNANNTYTYSASPDGRLLKTEGSKAYFVFDTPGNKKIQLSMSDGANIFNTVQDIRVELFKVQKRDFSSLVPQGTFDCTFYFDLNNDGLTEGCDGKIMKNQNGVFSPLGRSFNTDLEVGYGMVFTDYNMDGHADIMNYVRKWTTQYNALVNEEDLDFSYDMTPAKMKFKNGTVKEAYTIFAIGDLDNDGQPDVVYDQILFKRINQYEYEEIGYKINIDPRSYGALYCSDLNNDGLMDIVYPGNNIELLINKGNFEFTSKSIPGLYVQYIKDINNDGFPDFIRTEINYESCFAYLGSPDFTYTKTTLPGCPLKIDINNDGKTDYLKNSRVSDNYHSYLLISQPDNSYVSQEILHPIIDGFWEHHLFADTNNDGYPDYGYVEVLSNIKNEAPSVPQNVYIQQKDKSISLCWEASSDKETLNNALLYNISLKKKDATGPDSYLISPLNNTLNSAATPMQYRSLYRTGTSMEVPVSRFKAGTVYQLSVQSIDNWGAHSDFSQIYEFTVAPKVHISIPEKAIVNEDVKFVFHSPEGAKPVIELDGGEWTSETTARWNSPGLKKLRTTENNEVIETQILILAKPSITFNIPAKCIGGSRIRIPVSINWAGQKGDVHFEADNDTEISYNAVDGILDILCGTTDKATQIQATLKTDVTEVRETRDFLIVESAFIPEISRVSTDPASGKNIIQWDTNQPFTNALHFGNKVYIYRESNISDHYSLIGEAFLNDGMFMDSDSDPSICVNRYRISLSTNTNTESTLSTPHSSVHLMLSKGSGNNINLLWTPYEGGNIGQFTLWCGSSPSDLRELVTLSKNNLSYTHKRPDATPLYYAISYKEVSTPVRTKGIGSRLSDPGFSNTMYSEDAIQIKGATSVVIGSNDESYSITDEHPVIYLYARVLPASASIKRVQWEIIAGNELIDIDANGTIISKNHSASGTATVRATALDGSGIFADKDINVSALTSIDTNSATDIRIYKSNDCLYIKGIVSPVSVRIIDINGVCISHNIYNADIAIPVSSYKKGCYLINVGNITKKVLF